MSGVRPWTCPNRNDVVPIRPAAVARDRHAVPWLACPVHFARSSRAPSITSLPPGNRGGEIYRDDADRVTFLSRLLVTLERFEWDLHAWCLLSTHFHLLVTTRAPSIARGMQDVKSTTRSCSTGATGRPAICSAWRYAHRLVTSEAHLMNVYSYIALNPVRAGMCARPEDWWWSSYSGVLAHREGALFDRESLLVRRGAGRTTRSASRR